VEFSLSKKNAERIIEALLFTSVEPLSIKDLKKNLPQNLDIELVIETLQKYYETRGVNLKRVGNSIVLRTAKDLDHLFVTKKVTNKNLSRAARETLAIIAYHQPVTKLEIEEIRGVSVGTQLMRGLMDRGWIKIVGQRDVPGRPSVYATTKEFLDYFSLQHIRELPELPELPDLKSLDYELPLEEPEREENSKQDSQLNLTQ